MASRGKGKGAAKVPLLEWISAAIGLALILGVIAVIGWEAVRPGGAKPPAIEVVAAGIAPAPGGHVLEVIVRNRSRATASAVEIEGELKAEGEPETSRAMIDYVPGQSVRRAGLFFSQDPRRHPLTLRAVGYSKP